MPLFLNIRNINNVGLHFHIHVEILWHGRNVFPYSHDTLSQELRFLFAFSYSASAAETTFLEAVIVVSLSNFHGFLFTSFWGQEGRAFYSSEHFLAFLHHPIVSFGPHYQ